LAKQSNQPAQSKTISILDIPAQPAVMTIEELCVKFNLSRQMVEDTIRDGKVFAFTTGMSDKGKKKVSTWDFIRQAKLFPEEALIEAMRAEREREKLKEEQKKAS
jgi:hypothetical protein